MVRKFKSIPGKKPTQEVKKPEVKTKVETVVINNSFSDLVQAINKLSETAGDKNINITLDASTLPSAIDNTTQLETIAKKVEELNKAIKSKPTSFDCQVKREINDKITSVIIKPLK